MNKFFLFIFILCVSGASESAFANKNKVFKFDDELIEGSKGGTDLFSIVLKEEEGRKSLIRLRENFLPEIRVLSRENKKSDK